jgi:hypothetical protein
MGTPANRAAYCHHKKEHISVYERVHDFLKMRVRGVCADSFPNRCRLNVDEGHVKYTPSNGVRTLALGPKPLQEAVNPTQEMHPRSGGRSVHPLSWCSKKRSACIQTLS